jgi:hypothetical protein
MEKILLEKSTVAQLVKKFPASYGIQQLLQSLANFLAQDNARIKNDYRKSLYIHF